MTIKTLAERGTSCAEIGRLLKMPESNVRYHLKRIRLAVGDRRSLRPRRAGVVAEAIEHWMCQHEGAAVNLVALHEWLVAEHDYPGSLRSVQRFVGERYGAPPRRARRRVETPPGAQAQLDWAIFPGVSIGGQRRELSALLLSLSYSRYPALWWSLRRDQLSWLAGHNELLRRIGGVPAVIRIDNDTAAVAHGAGPWGRLSEPYRRYAKVVRFHVDLCLPRQPQAKGKIERRVRAARASIDPLREHWANLGELQRYSDEQMQREAARLRCPVTGTSVAEAWEGERRLLAALPTVLPEPFDTVA
ncbi:MAG: IS21 family transposase, partial [Burkholderiales bacterium]|nr:IS21 family transposase [Burkholderiales bacterium]